MRKCSHSMFGLFIKLEFGPVASLQLFVAGLALDTFLILFAYHLSHSLLLCLGFFNLFVQ